MGQGAEAQDSTGVKRKRQTDIQTQADKEENMDTQAAHRAQPKRKQNIPRKYPEINTYRSQPKRGGKVKTIENDEPQQVKPKLTQPGARNKSKKLHNDVHTADIRHFFTHIQKGKLNREIPGTSRERPGPVISNSKSKNMCDLANLGGGDKLTDNSRH